MAFELTTTAKLLSEQIRINQQFILKIDGYDEVFGAVEVTKLAFIGQPGLYIGREGWLVGGNVEIEESRAYISLDGSTKTISQQLRQDEGGTGSISSVKIRMIDKNNELSNLFFYSEGQDLISRQAQVYLSFAGSDHPTDSVKILDGIVEDSSFGAGYVDISIAHPEQLKRQELFTTIQTETTAAMTSSQTSIAVTSTSEYQVGSGSITSYIQIEDEIIKCESITSTSFGNLTRGQLGTLAVAHDIDQEAVSFYRLEGGAIDLALKLMLSTSETNFIEDEEITSFEFINLTYSKENSFLIPDRNFISRSGLTVGDTCSITGASNGANNVSGKEVLAIISDDNGTIITLSDVSFTEEITTNAVCSFQSRYNVLLEGCGLTPNQVDIKGHVDLNNTYGAGFHTYDFYIKETIEAKKFIEQEIYFPSGMYQLPRQGRSGVGFTSPPIVTSNSVSIDSTNIKYPEKIKMSRSINKNFYNAINFKYDELSYLDKFTSGLLTIDEDSANRIKVGSRPMLIQAKGVRTYLGGKPIMETQSRRFLDRYKYASETVEVDILYKAGFAMDVGDIVLFGDSSLKISDSKSGNRDFSPRLMEVTNKTLNIVTGDIKLKLTDTAFDASARFGSLSPSSIIGTGSTTTSIIITTSYGWKGLEREKWEQSMGETILLRNDDFSLQYECKLESIDSGNDYALNVSGLSTAPSAGMIVQSPLYPSTTNLIDNELWKTLHTYLNKQGGVYSGATTSTSFYISPGVVDSYNVGDTIRVHSADFSFDSGEVKILTKNESTGLLTVEDMGGVPFPTCKIDLLVFNDGGKPYRFL